jgi:serine/threonine-protein kinase
MLAVLPLENIGPADQDYFVDGLTDEITTKLCGVSGLRVIAQSSASQYKKTTKTITQIGKELGAAYLLRGTVRWERMSDGTQHLRANPQLIQVSDGSQVWSQSYEGPLTGVFEMQSNIATQVAQAMGVALLAEEQKAVAEKPTSNMEAYGYHLMGRQLWGKADREATLQAIRMLKNAVELDSSFTAAYSCLAGAYGWLYFQGKCRDQCLLEEAREVADRAIALNPASVDAYIAQAYYHYYGYRDYDRALTFLNSALAKSPSNSDVLELVGYLNRRQGRFADAADLLERSLILNPRSFWLSWEIAYTYWFLRDYAKAEEYLLRETVIEPEDSFYWDYLSKLYLVWRGDTAAARAALQRGTKHTDSLKLGFAFWYIDLVERDYASAEKHLHGILATPGVDTAAYYLAKATTARLMGKEALAHACFDSLRVDGEKSIHENPTYYSGYSQAGLAYAGLGRKEEAIAMGKRGVELMTPATDAFEAQDALYFLARIYAMVGDQDAAIAQIEQLLAVPSFFSANSFRLEPYWIPLWNSPRFQKLLEKYGT